MAQANSLLIDLKKRINVFCEKHLPQLETIGKVKYGKIVHDSTWGTNHFEKHEVEIINTPLFQRLRGVNQMGFVDYVYPSARHSRFEHSLGVTVLASRMVDAVLNKGTSLVDDNTKKSIRLSALLHDVGHCMFSHTSELIYGAYLEGYIDEEFNDKYKKPSPHEFFSYLIVTSDAFRKYFEKICDEYDLGFKIDEIASRIVGRIQDQDERDRYKTDFINGPIDADKLDYFHRDSQFSGIPIQLDIDRLLHEINISKISQDESVRALTVSISGITCIEQFIFNKMILYSTIYAHHKVESIDCMLKGVFEYIMDNNVRLKIGDEERTIQYPDDFLYLADYNLFAISDSTTDDELKRLINNIRERKLLKRAFVISRKTLKKAPDMTNHNCNQLAKDLLQLIERGDLDDKKKLIEIKDTLESLSVDNPIGMSGIIELLDQGNSKLDKQTYLRDLAKKIYDEAMIMSGNGLKCHPYEVWIDMPKSPSSKEIQNMMVRINKEGKSECKSIDKYFPFAQYEDIYENNRLNGYVFAPEDSIDYISKAAKKVLEETLGVKFNDLAFEPVSRYSN